MENAKEIAAHIAIRTFYFIFAYFLLKNLPAVDGEAIPSAFLIAGSALSVVSAFFPERYSVRLLTCAVSLFGLYFAIWSPVKTNHTYFGWIYALIMFSLSPLKDARKTLYYAQVLALTVYTLAGFWKIKDAIAQCLHSVISQCSQNGFSTLLAETLTETHRHSLLSDLFISYPWIGFLGLWIVMLYQFAVLFLFIRFPRHRVLWALGICLFHLMVWLVMRIDFFEQLFVILFLFAYPICVERALAARRNPS